MIHIQGRLAGHRRLDKLHRDVLDAMDAALEAANPKTIIRKRVKVHGNKFIVDGMTYWLERYRRIFVLGAGKASGGMGEEIEKLLGPKIAQGVVIVPDYLKPWPKGRRITYVRASHPIPTEKTVQRTAQLLGLAESAGSEDLTIMLLSGGASSLMELPVSGLTLEDQRKTTDLLLKSAAKIQETNIVRKHLSRIKGGRLAESLRPARVLTLIISDVVGDQLDSIGSGPTVPDPTTYKDARDILENHSIWSKIPRAVKRVVEQGIRGAIPETPKEEEGFRHVTNLVLGSNRESCMAAVKYMKKRGYNAHLLSTHIVGEAREAGKVLGSILADIHDSHLFPSPAAIISGGETTVTVRGTGNGGRNQELALAAAVMIQGSKRLVLGSFGTDGVDGPTDAAGAIVDGTTVARGRRRGLDPEAFLKNNDSHSYFARIGDLVKTGPTGTNVNDITIMVAR